MLTASRWIRVVVFALVMVTAGCGGGSGVHAGNASSSSSADTSRQPGRPVAGFGVGASFAPRSSLLYVSRTGDASAWAALSHVRSRIPFGGSWSVSSAGNLFAELLSGRTFDIATSPVASALTGYGSETLASFHGVKGLPVGLLPDVVIYSGVNDQHAVEQWLATTSQRIGKDGTFDLYHAKQPHIGYDAVSAHAWIFAYSLASLRRAIAVGTGHEPSLATDPSALDALSAVDSRGAALVGYSRGDLLRELTATHENLADSGDGTDTLKLTPALGLTDTAFAIGAHPTGFWINSAPRLTATSYRPGPQFTPTLQSGIPKNELLYVGVKNGASQWPQLDRALTSYATGTFGTSNAAPTHLIESLISTYFRFSPTDIAHLGTGEQAWYFGDTIGTSIDPTNLAQTLATAEAMTHRALPYSGASATHTGSVVSITNTALAHNARIPGPRPTILIQRAHLDQPISLIAAVDLAPLTSLLAGDDQPDHAIDGIVISTTPGTGLRYRFDAYIDVAP
jgi:hypothetical protein